MIMALGGGTFTSYNKTLPGSYINFVNTKQASGALSERGTVAMPVILPWGKEDGILEVTAEDFYKNSTKLLGYDFTAGALKYLRELFVHCKKAYLYRVNAGVKASNTYATAKYSGTRGNDIKIVITTNENSTPEAPLWDVDTLLDGVTVDSQKGVSSQSALKENDFVTWRASATLAATAGTALSGGTDGDAQNSAYQAFLDTAEAYGFDVLAYAGTDETIKALFANYTKRLRDEQGVKFQCVLYKYEKADHEGVISVENKLSGESTSETGALVYWVAGAEAACAVNSSLTNALYDGELYIDAEYTQAQLSKAISSGKLVFHKVGSDARVLTDINTLTSVTAAKGDDFKSNQVIRVLDMAANDIAYLFNAKHLGKTQNNADGRASLWSDIVSEHRSLEKLGAIENFDSDSLTVYEGDSKTSVVVNEVIKPVAAMEKLYMTIMVG